MGTNIHSTAGRYVKGLIIEFNYKITTKQFKTSMQNIQKGWKSVGLRQQEENKHSNELNI